MKRHLIGTLITLLCLYQTNNAEIVLALEANNTAPINISVEDVIGSSPLVQRVPNGRFPGGASLNTAPKPIISSQITKTISSPWKMEVSSGTSNNDLSVQYELNSLDHLTVSNSKIRVLQIRSLGLRTESEAAETKVVTDDAEFTFDLSGIKASGNYSGNLKVTITGI